MDFSRDPPKPKSFTSLFFGKKQKQPMHIPNNPSNVHLEPGLKTLTTNDNSKRSLSCVNRSKIVSSAYSSLSSFISSPPSSTFSSPLSSSPSMDEIKDHKKERENPYPIIHQNKEKQEEQHKQEEEEEREDKEKEETCKRFSGRRLKKSMTEKRQYPPPIPMLAQTENLPCHMPFVYKRSSSVGRLVIKEVRVKHHEFFRAHRSNGRLTLQLVQLEDKGFPPRPKQENSEQADAKPEHEDQENQANVQKNQEHRQNSGENLETPEKLEQDKENPEKIDEENQEKDEYQMEKIQSMLENVEILEDNEETVGKEAKEVENMASSSSSNEDDNAKMQSPSLILPRRPDNGQDGDGENQPSILPSSMSESSFIGMGLAGGCFSSGSLFQMPIPTIRPVHS